MRGGHSVFNTHNNFVTCKSSFFRGYPQEIKTTLTHKLQFICTLDGSIQLPDTYLDIQAPPHIPHVFHTSKAELPCPSQNLLSCLSWTFPVTQARTLRSTLTTFPHSQVTQYLTSDEFISSTVFTTSSLVLHLCSSSGPPQLSSAYCHGSLAVTLPFSHSF